MLNLDGLYPLYILTKRCTLYNYFSEEVLRWRRRWGGELLRAEVVLRQWRGFWAFCWWNKLCLFVWIYWRHPAIIWLKCKWMNKTKSDLISPVDHDIISNGSNEYQPAHVLIAGHQPCTGCFRKSGPFGFCTSFWKNCRAQNKLYINLGIVLPIQKCVS